MNPTDTIVAPATVPGTGAIAVIRLSGSRAIELADAIVDKSLSDAGGYTVHHCCIKDVDDVLVTVFRAPRSYTGEDSVEISCHASSYIVQQIVLQLVALGARNAEPGEFTQRAFVNGKMDLAQAEAVADVIASQSEAAHRVALSQLRGGYSAELRSLRGQMLELASLLELELDFSEEDVEFADRAHLAELLAAATGKVSRLAESFRTGNAVKNGVPVAIVGAPNSGKSTLLNRLLGEDRAIVSNIAGTTRDTIEETMVLGGICYRFIDTAGIRETADVVESMGVERSIAAMRRADVVIGVVDASLPPEARNEAENWLSAHVDCRQTLITVFNKADIAAPVDVSASQIRLSALTGEGVDALLEALSSSQEGRLSSAGTLVTNARHYAALVQALSSLEALERGIALGLTPDLLAEHLRSALSDLGSITGEISSDEVLGEIFAKFCIGK